MQIKYTTFSKGKMIVSKFCPIGILILLLYSVLLCFVFTVSTTTWPASWEICMPVRKQQFEMDMEQQTGSKFWKEYNKAVYCHPVYLNLYAEYIRWNGWSTAGIKVAGRNINNLRYADDTTLTAESKEELKSLLMKVKKESEKVG